MYNYCPIISCYDNSHLCPSTFKVCAIWFDVEHTAVNSAKKSNLRHVMLVPSSVSEYIIFLLQREEIKEIDATIRLFRKLKNILHRPVLVIIYKALVRLHLD